VCGWLSAASTLPGTLAAARLAPQNFDRPHLGLVSGRLAASWRPLGVGASAVRRNVKVEQSDIAGAEYVSVSSSEVAGIGLRRRRCRRVIELSHCRHHRCRTTAPAPARWAKLDLNWSCGRRAPTDLEPCCR